VYYYCSERHPVFRTPPDSNVIWRYQTLAKLLSIAETGRLFFCRASKFKDPFEGAVPKALDDNMRAYARTMSSDAYDHYRNERIRARGIVAISCWHRSEHESEAMWSLYGLSGEGVAIKSTVGRLAKALPQKTLPKGTTDIHGINIGHVGYIDYATAHFPPDNTMYPYVHKRMAFEHEREVRAVTMISEGARKAFDAGGVDFEISPGGLGIPIDVAMLIEAVYVAPLGSASFERVVRTTLERFGYGAVPVIKSPMAEVPIY
jgi:hypothetical protein